MKHREAILECIDVKAFRFLVQDLLKSEKKKKKLEWWPIRESREDTGEYCVHVTVYI